MDNVFNTNRYTLLEKEYRYKPKKLLIIHYEIIN